MGPSSSLRRRLLLALAASAFSTPRPVECAAPPPGRFRVVLRIPATEARVRDSREAWDIAAALSPALAAFGYVEGRNLAIVSQFNASTSQEFEAQLAEIRKDRVDAIVVVAPGALRWQKRFPGVPIVAWGAQEPVQEGLARSFVRPGGTITGTTQGMEEVPRKQVELLRKFVPGLTGIALFLEGNPPPDSPWGITFRLTRDWFESAIRDGGLQVTTLTAPLDAALEALPALRARGFQAAIYMSTPVGREYARRHVEAAIRARIATVNEFSHLADWGFLLSYGEQEAEFFKRVAQQLDRIFRGTKPGDIPFINPSRYHLRVNRRTAAALGLAIPPEVLLMADHVVE